VAGVAAPGPADIQGAIPRPGRTGRPILAAADAVLSSRQPRSAEDDGKQ
jgi:hypothetical protein